MAILLTVDGVSQIGHPKAQFFFKCHHSKLERNSLSQISRRLVALALVLEALLIGEYCDSLIHRTSVIVRHLLLIHPYLPQVCLFNIHYWLIFTHGNLIS